MPNFQNSVPHIQNGEAVESGPPRRVAEFLQQNIRHIKDRLDTAELGQLLVTPELPINPALQVGQPVYYDATTNRLEGGLASVIYDATLGVLTPAASAEILGIVHSKPTSNTAVVAMRGWSTVSLTVAVGGTPTSGWYYLSATTPGRLVKSPPNFKLAMVFVTGTGSVYIDPSRRANVDEHAHFAFDLTCRPAGSHEPPDEDVHEITDADDELPGWLPADDASFGDTAPEGALFGYNLAQDAPLSRVWPPFPLEAVSFSWDKGQDLLGGTDIPCRGDRAVIKATKDGIWWMSNCEGDVPWPNVEFTDGEPEEEVEGPACPRAEAMRLTVYFSVARYMAARTVVTSLTAEEGSFIEVTGCDGAPATTGDLKLNTTLALAIADAQDATGHLVVKEVTTDKKLKRGPVVGGLIAGANTTLTSTASAVETVNATPGVTVHRGFVTVSVPLSSSERELMPALVKLSDARDRTENGLLYVGLPKQQISSIRMTFYVPPAGIANPNDLKFRLVVLGTVTGQLPALTVKYRILQPASGSGQNPPSSDTTTTVTMPSLTAGYYALVETPAISVPRGATLFLDISRAGSTDGYSGEVGLLRTTALLL
jgi:hypothetical protein